MKFRQVFLLGMVSSVAFFSACSVYESSDIPPDMKQKGHKKRNKHQTKSRSHGTMKKNQESSRQQKHQESPPKKLQASKPANQIKEESTANKVIVINPSRFLMGYGVVDMKIESSDSDAKEDAYFNARRMLAFSIYTKFSQALDKNHLKSDHLKNILLFSIDKAIDSIDIYKEKRYIVLPHYHKVLGLFFVDSSVLERIRQLVRVQYNFTNQQRDVIDRLIYNMQNEDTLH